jgi:hypothetical protein
MKEQKLLNLKKEPLKFDRKSFIEEASRTAEKLEWFTNKILKHFGDSEMLCGISSDELSAYFYPVNIGDNFSKDSFEEFKNRSIMFFKDHEGSSFDESLLRILHPKDQFNEYCGKCSGTVCYGTIQLTLSYIDPNCSLTKKTVTRDIWVMGNDC